MRLILTTLSSRVLVLPWLVAWVLILPLFHVHPEADHLHDKAGHVHGGTVHTVFSDGLPCEFSNHEGSASPQGIVSKHVSEAGHDHQEFGFSLLTDATDRRPFKSFGTHPAIIAVAIERTLLAGASVAQEPTSNPSTLLYHDRPSRAPPVLFS